MDRISELPDFIVHRILYFLFTKHGPPAELVRMSVLSKTWFHLTATFPILDFCSTEFRSRKRFFKYLDYTVSRFCHQNQYVTARRLMLFATISEPAELEIVNRCLGLLLKKGVRDLVIYITHLSQSPSASLYRLPNALLSVSVLESLTVYHCDLPSSLMLDDIKFKSLITLRLENVRIDDEAINCLTTSCPLLREFSIKYCHSFKRFCVHGLLREFSIKYCHSFKRFCVHGHQNLRSVGICYYAPVERIDIEAPNLSDLYLADLVRRGAPQMNLASCKKLTLVTCLGLTNSNGSTNFVSNFPFVKNLVWALPTSKCNNLKLSSNTLRTLVLRSNCGLEDIEFSTPNLGLFVYSCNAFYPWDGVAHLPHLKACMRCYPINGSIDALWFQKLRLFLDKKNGFKPLNLYIITGLEFRVLINLKAIELPPYELEHVELHLLLKESSDRAAFVDAVLLCCRPRSLTLRSCNSLTDFEEQSDLVKFTYKRLLQQEDESHISIQIVSPSSSKAQTQFRGLMRLWGRLLCEEKAISFIKEEVLQEEAFSQRFADMEIC